MISDRSMGTGPLTFPAGFGWGTATASYQIEGAVDVDGRVPSIWDTFSHSPGKVFDGTNGDRANDHYRRWHEDVELLGQLGAPYYRFSLAWPRLQFDQSGQVNARGLDFYRRLADELRARGITPWVTLYHWDLPQWIEDHGGWPARDTAYRFADYAESAYQGLADHISYWTTLNEPYCSSMLAYADGEHAPGRQEPDNAIRAVHHLLLGHGLAVQRLRAAERNDLQVGITLNQAPTIPWSDSPADLDAARRVGGIANRFFLDPVLTGAYPADIVADLQPLLSFEHVRDGDMELISQPLDALGINNYRRNIVRAGGPEAPDRFRPGTGLVGAGDVELVRRGWPVTARNWEIDPEGIRDLLIHIWRDYDSPPLWITENGSAWNDIVSADGQVHDQARIDYLDSYIRAIHQAIEAGVDLRGYFVWTSTDNFEWAYGEASRFGLIHVDFETQRRTPKDSFAWFKAVAARNGLA